MNRGGLRTSYRRAFQDMVEPYFVSDEEFNEYINEADLEACRRTKCLVTTDVSTGESKAISTITILGESGTVTGIYINNVNIINNPVEFAGNQNITASLISNEINNKHLYTAIVQDNEVFISPLDGVGAELNNIVPIVLGNLDTSTAAFYGGINGICKINVEPGVSSYAINSKIIKPNQYYFGDERKVLPMIDYRELDNYCSGWQAEKGEPVYVVHGLNSKKITLYKTPTEKGVIVINATHLPVKTMETDRDEPNADEDRHSELINWVLFKAYSKNDSETQNGSAAKFFYDRFVQVFGEGENAEEQASRRVFAINNSYGDY